MQSGATLGRLIQRAAPARADERCDLCGAPLPETHRHVLDVPADELRCACQACGLLFEREAAAQGQYRLVPRRRLRLDAGPGHAELGVPVGLAFFVARPDGTVLVRYPSPVGATTWECDDAAWARLRARWPQLDDVAPSVEALLVNAARGRSEYWIVPIDDCYRLVAVVREHWKGLSGGREVWPAVDQFFAELGKEP
jgi:hypothetical protein